MKYLSLFSGIEAASVAWHDLGWTPMGFSEIEPFPCAVLKHRFPDVPNLGDVTKIHETEIFKKWQSERTIDLVVGGSPCQSFSVAGLRKGLDDPRGNLALVYLGIIDKLRPRFFIWENVCGVLSSNGGRDFGSFLGAIQQLGYGFAYRVLDAQYVRTHSHPRAVPQRRRRVFVVGSLGGWQRAAQVLFDIESLSGNPPPRRTKGKGAVGTTQGGSSYAIRTANTGANGHGIAKDVTHTLDLTNSNAVMDINREVAGTLDAHYGEKMGIENQHVNAGCPNFVIENHPADLIVFNDQGGGVMNVEKEEISPTLRRETHNHEPIIIENHANDSRFREYGELDPINTLDARMGTEGGNVDLVAEPIGLDEEQNATEGFFGTLKARTEGGGFEGAVAESVQWQSGFSVVGNEPEVAHTLVKNQINGLSYNYRIRRLTPAECERLQGFPDGWTGVPFRNKPASDGPRYKSIGNSMAVNVMAWIGQRIQMVEDSE